MGVSGWKEVRTVSKVSGSCGMWRNRLWRRWAKGERGRVLDRSKVRRVAGITRSSERHCNPQSRSDSSSKCGGKGGSSTSGLPSKCRTRSSRGSAGRRSNPLCAAFKVRRLRGNRGSRGRQQPLMSRVSSCVHSRKSITVLRRMRHCDHSSHSLQSCRRKVVAEVGIDAGATARRGGGFFTS